jgi:dihydrodipicolinate synthase/N-acetylneuraminate lyase
MIKRIRSARHLFSVSSGGARDVKYRPPQGLSVPVVTVLDRSGRVLHDEQRAVIRYAIQDGAGANIIFAVGTTGEWNRLDNPCRQLVARIAVDECRRAAQNRHSVEAWVGITAHTRVETLANLDHALDIDADAAVIAPLSITDVDDPVEFVTRDVGSLFDRRGRRLPIFLYDNEDIAAAGKAPHLPTGDVKQMSLLDYVRGIKVTAGKAVLGNYTRAAAHFNRSGEFAIYPGNAYLIFDLLRARDGLTGYLRHQWNRYLTSDALPHGVVAGAANLMPREWQRAWQVCSAGEESLIDRYAGIMEDFRTAGELVRGGKGYRPTIACLKAALAHIGVISSEAVAEGTKPLERDERREFLRRFTDMRRRACVTLEPEWLSHWAQRPVLMRALQDA